jgi:hypothetical protein
MLNRHVDVQNYVNTTKLISGPTTSYLSNHTPPHGIEDLSQTFIG